MILIHNYNATLVSLSQAHAKSNKKEILDTLVLSTYFIINLFSLIISVV